MTEIFECLRSCQEEFKALQRTQTNTEFSSRYADLGAVMDYVLPILTKHGLVLVQMPTTSLLDKSVSIQTTLFHAATGNYITNTLELPCSDDSDRFDASLVAKVISFGRRIALKPILGLSEAGEDDDGQTTIKRSSHVNGERITTVTGKILNQKEADGRYEFELDSYKTLISYVNSHVVSRLIDQVGKVISVKAQKLQDRIYELVEVGTVISVESALKKPKGKEHGTGI